MRSNDNNISMVGVSVVSGLSSTALPSPPYMTTIGTPVQHGNTMIMGVRSEFSRCMKYHR